MKGHVHEVYYNLLLFTGMRESEGLGLTWDDIDFKENTIAITKQLIRDRNTGEYYFAAPKDDEFRTIHVPTELIALLEAQKKAEQKNRLIVEQNGRTETSSFQTKTGDSSRTGRCMTATNGYLKKLGWIVISASMI